MSTSRAALSRQLPVMATAFAALGDPTRLAVVTRLCDGSSRSISELGDATALSRQALSKHLRVLEHARLVQARRRGRECRYSLDPKRIGELHNYLGSVSAQWGEALARLREFVET